MIICKPEIYDRRIFQSILWAIEVFIKDNECGKRHWRYCISPCIRNQQGKCFSICIRIMGCTVVISGKCWKANPEDVGVSSVSIFPALYPGEAPEYEDEIYKGYCTWGRDNAGISIAYQQDN